MGHWDWGSTKKPMTIFNPKHTGHQETGAVFDLQHQDPTGYKKNSRNSYQDIGLSGFSVGEKDGMVTHKVDNGTVQPTKWYSNSKKLVIPFSQPPVLWVAEYWKQRKGKSTIHFNGEFMNTEFLNHTRNSVNQVSVYAAVTDWCYKFTLTKEAKEHIPTPVDNRILAIVDPEEVGHVDIFSESRTGDTWCRVMQASEYWKRRLTWPQLCEKALFQYLVTAGRWKRRMEDKSHLYADNILVLESFHKPSHWELFQQVQVLHRTTRFILSKFLTEYRLELAIPSICRPGDVIYGTISRENRALCE